MKKTILLLLGIAIIVVGIMIFDYKTNHRSFSANLYTVTTQSYQEQMCFSAPVKRQGNLYLMSGAVRKIENVTVGSVAEITLQGNAYQGYLYRLEPTFDGIYYATVSVTGLGRETDQSATAMIFGNILGGVMFIPPQCLTTDQAGQDAVFVVQDGYAMLRRVQTGPLVLEEKRQISQGIFPGEKLIISPKNIRTGDLIFDEKS